MKIREGSVTSPSGFLAAGTSCGLKESGKLDLALLVSEKPAVLSAVFTINRVKAAPVLRGMKLLARGSARAFLVNSGCANACTGDDGLRDADDTAAAAAAALEVSSDDVFIASTGVIGETLDTEKIRKAVVGLAGSLSNEGGKKFARAIMTTDTVPKTAAVNIKLSGGTVSVGGCSKGAGMISPKMATMLAFFTTDAEVPADKLAEVFRAAVDLSFNRITIDGHMSTNDTAVIMANGASGIGLVTEDDAEAFSEGLTLLCRHLAREMVRDGEGATKLVEIEVTGAPSDDGAEDIARRIADSPLVKCAINGADPNWGRIVSAAGCAGVEFDPADVTLDIGAVRVFEKGVPSTFDRTQAADHMNGKEVCLVLSVGAGKGSACLWTCDLSAEYVEINAEYTT
ncbi:MAG: bifunctional glutamate N-acetyltransferase/amino-acid acetyltransferase ArgJ [Candidatus Hydrogenedentes bacterium]|nr:bifunctional glutamate N-acetyltransferase/amino-acid acetyltransferase ArgJ [Candidatus Hydrogenedentota bacterium]